MAAEAGGGEKGEAGVGRTGDRCNISGKREYEVELGWAPRRFPQEESTKANLIRPSD